MARFETNFERSLTSADRKQNIPFPVQVPAGTTRMRIRLNYSPQVVGGINNLLTLTVFDPVRWRGSGHRHGKTHEVVIGEGEATPGYSPGPLPPGTWRVVLDTHMIMDGPDCRVKIQVEGSDEPAGRPAPEWKPGRTAPRGPGWYQGDLHAHTLHSDASWDVNGLVSFARRKRLDFTTLSDHNTVTGLPEMEAARDDQLLTMGGMELTTFWGHALALGLRSWVNWHTDANRTMKQIAREVGEQGGLFIIGHPMEAGDPICTGCRWDYPEMKPGIARVVEVWNGEWDSEGNNSENLDLVFRWLNEGCRLALTAGTDNHGGNADAKRYGFNIVYAEELSEKAILEAISRGHLYLSSGPRLQLEARVGDRKVMMGDALNMKRGETVQIQAGWESAPADAWVELVLDGVPQAGLQAGEASEQAWEVKGGEARWGLVMLRDADGQVLALTNPVYLDGRG